MVKRKVELVEEELSKGVERKEDMEASLEGKKQDGWRVPENAVEKAREIDTQKKELDAGDEQLKDLPGDPVSEDKMVPIEELLLSKEELDAIAQLRFYSHPVEFIRDAVREKLEEYDDRG